MNLFAYGTLMCEDIMAEVSGCRLSFVTGTLKGFCRRAVKGEQFPALIPDGTGIVDGIIYLDLPDKAWERLDRFEGRMYDRRKVEVVFDDGTVLPTATYVVHSGYEDRLEPHEWDFERFLLNGKARFQKGYRGYRHL